MCCVSTNSVVYCTGKKGYGMKRLWLCIVCTFILLLSCACREPAPPESTGDETTVATTRETTVSKTTTQQTKSTAKPTTTVIPTLKRSEPKTTVATTVATTAADTAQLPQWKQVYMFTAQVESGAYDSFALLDIDDDNVPEMFMHGKDGHAMRAYRENGMGDGRSSVIQQKLNKNNGVHYIPKSGRFMNVYVDGDHLTLKVYELTATRGFVEVFTGYEYTYQMPDTTLEQVYYIDGSIEPLTKAEFEEKLDTVFKMSSAVSLKDKPLTLEKFNEQVRNW